MNQQTVSADVKRASQKRIRCFVICVALLFVLVAINVVVCFLPGSYTLFDVSDQAMGHVSRDTRDFVASLEEEVTIYWLCAGGLSADKGMISFLTRYLEAGEKVSLKVIDTVEYPDFASQYTANELTDGSLIVESRHRARVIDALDMYYLTNEYVDTELGSHYQLSVQEYTALYEQFGEYMDQTATIPYFCGEALLTSAIDYVIQETIPHTYLLTGDHYGVMNEGLQSILTSMSLTPEVLELQKHDKVPDDASCVLIFAPTADLSDHETALITSYVKDGGAVLLVSGPEDSGYQNLASICQLFGMSPADGLVVEPSDNYHRNDISQLLPLINSNHMAMYYVGSAGYLAYMPNACGISIDETLPTGVSAMALLATSETGYRVSEDSAQTPLCMPSSQYVAAYATLDTTTADGTIDKAYITWFASEDAFEDEAASAYYYGNYYYLAMSVSQMADSETFTSKYTTIAAVDLSVPRLETSDAATGTILPGLLMIVVLPLGIAGICVGLWLGRRRQ